MNNNVSDNVSNINMERIYREIAKNDNVSVEKVKKEMNLTIDTMWERQSPKAKKLFPNGKPSLDEFLITIYKISIS